MLTVTITWRNDNPMTIANQLKAKLGREPTHAELKAEVRRIFTECTVARAERGALRHQKGKL